MAYQLPNDVTRFSDEATGERDRPTELTGSGAQTV
jgi:hypothetical protein